MTQKRTSFRIFGRRRKKGPLWKTFCKKSWELYEAIPSHKRSHESGRGLGTRTSKGVWKTQGGPLLVTNRDITPISMVITPFTHLWGHSFGGYVTPCITCKGPPCRERYIDTAFIYGEMILLMVQTSWEHQSEGGSISHNLAVIFCKSKVLRHSSSIHGKIHLIRTLRILRFATVWWLEKIEVSSSKWLDK